MSTYTFGTQGARFVGDATAQFTDPPERLDWPISFQPDSKIDAIVFTVRRSDGATFEFTAQRREENPGHMMEWHAGEDPEFLLEELFRRANDHFEAERKAASA